MENWYLGGGSEEKNGVWKLGRNWEVEEEENIYARAHMTSSSSSKGETSKEKERKGQIGITGIHASMPSNLKNLSSKYFNIFSWVLW